MIKLIALDLDDTLLNSKGMVSEYNKLLLKECYNRGIKIGYITVRSPRKMNVFLNDLPCDFIANYNGASIYANGNLIKTNVIPFQDGIEFIKNVLTVAPNIKIGAYFEPYFYNSEILTMDNKEIAFSGNWNTLPKSDFQRIRIVLDGYENLVLTTYSKSTMLVQKTVNNTAIIVNKEATKENALEEIVNYYGFTMKDVLSFGDDLVDLEMIKCSGCGVAMENGIKEIKENAHYVTLSNDEDGVGVFIKKHVLNKLEEK